MRFLVWLLVLGGIGIWVYTNAGGVGVAIYVVLAFSIAGAIFGSGNSSNSYIESESQADIQSRLDEDNVMDKDISQ